MFSKPARIECVTPEFGQALSKVILRGSNHFTLAELATKIVHEGDASAEHGEDTLINYTATLKACDFSTKTDLRSIVACEAEDNSVVRVSSISIAAPFFARSAMSVYYLPKRMGERVVRLFGEGVVIEEHYPNNVAPSALPRIECEEYVLGSADGLANAANEARAAALRFFDRCS